MLLRFLGHHYELFRWFLSWIPSWFLNYSSKLRAWRAYQHAKLRVPGYRSYIGATVPHWFAGVPETDKQTYIKVFSTAERCLDGTIPLVNTVVDESSGSTGVAYNWVRSLDERLVSHGFVSYFGRYCFGVPNLFTINAFSMGSWATGLNMGLSMQHNGIVKNVGPDVDKILSTLEFFGTKYSYLVTGYPPFLKHLIDVARARGFPLASYTLYGLAGGEGMSEGLRRYLERVFQKVFSGYGATDLEIGIAGETRVTVAIRQAAEKNPQLRRALFGDDSRLPMVFHYNPLMHYIEVNAERELVFTITRLNVLSPRIRYNIHDEGGVMNFPDMVACAQMYGLDLAAMFGAEWHLMPKLPFLWVYGRKDSTISVMGANIYPEDLEAALYANPGLAASVRSFSMSLYESTDGSVRPQFEFEIFESITTDMRACFEEKITEHLIMLNRDFAEAWHEHPAALEPVVMLWPVGTGPFAQNEHRIKQVRISTS